MQLHATFCIINLHMYGSSSEAGVLDDPDTQLSQLSGVAILARQAMYIVHTVGWMDTFPAYVDWRACAATPLSGFN
jgi:hypothetical protein